jgi:hypothetical protein
MSKIAQVEAECLECTWKADTPGGLSKNRMAGYNHFMKTGHKVVIRKLSSWIYEPNKNHKR